MRDDEAVAALHNAARRYCIERHDRWCDEYTKLQESRPVTFAKSYSDDDYRVFPRYNVLAAILSAVERWVPGKVATLAEARARLIDAARNAHSPQTDSSQPLANEAMAEERAAFERFLVESTADDWAKASPVPYRRALARSEADELYRSFEGRWGNWSGGYSDRVELPPHLTLHVEVRNALPLDDAVRAFLAARGIDRLFELQETGDGFEIDATATAFTYDWESYWFVAGCPWMIYASHESSITFGGAELCDELRSRLPGVDAFVYDGWDDPPSQRLGFTGPMPARPR